jgi:hypothetical protein
MTRSLILLGSQQALTQPFARTMHCRQHDTRQSFQSIHLHTIAGKRLDFLWKSTKLYLKIEN